MIELFGQCIKSNTEASNSFSYRWNNNWYHNDLFLRIFIYHSSEQYYLVYNFDDCQQVLLALYWF